MKVVLSQTPFANVATLPKDATSGAVIPSLPYLPESAHEETVAGTAYMVYEGTYYRPFASEDETIYMVVDDPRETDQ